MNARFSALAWLILSLLILGTSAASSQSRDIKAEVPPVEVVLYSDFQCPFCAQFAQPFRELHTRGIDGVAVEVQFKHFPLAIHPDAPLAHQASWAAKAQGKFWEMHDLIFANQRRLKREDLIGHARTLGLDLIKFEADMDGEEAKRAIALDLAEGSRVGVSGTPSYTIGGKLQSGTRTYAQLKELIAGDLLRQRALAECLTAP